MLEDVPDEGMMPERSGAYGVGTSCTAVLDSSGGRATMYQPTVTFCRTISGKPENSDEARGFSWFALVEFGCCALGREASYCLSAVGTIGQKHGLDV